MTWKVPAALASLGAAAAYGCSFPFAKDLIDERVDKLALAGLVYLSQVAAIGTATLLRGIPSETRLRGFDWYWLATVVVTGGIAAPTLFFFGQALVPSHVAALLAPTETLFTVLIAVLVFRERLAAPETVGVLFLISGALIVSARPGEGGHADGAVLGAVLVAASFLMWGIDNNCTTRIAHRDPMSIALAKALVGGAATVAAAWFFGSPFPTDPRVLARIAGIGIVCFGGSYLLLILGMRRLGAARALALFACNPAFGIGASWLFRGEVPSTWAILGGLLMGLGVAMIVREAVRKEHAASAAGIPTPP